MSVPGSCFVAGKLVPLSTDPATHPPITCKWSRNQLGKNSVVLWPKELILQIFRELSVKDFPLTCTMDADVAGKASVLSSHFVPGSPPHGSAQDHSLGSIPAWNFGTPADSACAQCFSSTCANLCQCLPRILHRNTWGCSCSSLPAPLHPSQNPSHFPDLSQSRNFQKVLS